MKARTKAEFVFVLLVFGLIYYVVNNDVSITGFAIQTSGDIEQVSPVDNYETSPSEIVFIFKYSPDIEMKQCTLKFEDQPVKIINSMFSSTGTRLKLSMQPGEYYWSIECYDMHDTKYDSPTRHLNVLDAEKPAYTKTTFFGKDGFMYEFDITNTLDISIPGIQPNDVLRANQGKNTYEASVILLIQDYSTGLNFIELMLTPGSKRIRLEEGSIVPIDFNNDGTDDVNVKLESVAYRKATLSVKSARLIEQPVKEEQKPSLISAPTITISSTAEDKPEQASNSKPEEQLPLGTESSPFTLINFVSAIAIIILIIFIVALSNYYFRASKEKKPEAQPTAAVSKTVKSPAKRKQKKAKKKTKKVSAKNKKSRKPAAAKRPKPKQKKAKKGKR